MKRTIAVFLLVCMFAALLPGMAFAAGDTAQAEPAATEKKASDVKLVFNSGLYVAANADAGLAGKVAVTFDALGASGTLYLPGKADAAQLCFSWKDTGITVSKGGVVYENGTAPVAPVDGSVTYKIKKGLAVAYVTVKTLQGSADVEPLFLELDESLGTIADMNGDKDHETSCYGKALYAGIDKPISIKGRGNSTWKFDKKPYNITFYKKDDYEKKDKTEMIPGVKAKKWSLIANYLDNSQMRNKIAMDLANELGIGLDTRFVDVWMNGEYRGNYLLTPKNDYAAPDGGYVLESDNYYEHGEGSDPQFQLPDMWEIGPITHDEGYYNRITVKDIGDDAADAGVDPAAIETYFLGAWSALRDYDSEDYQNYFDMDSWAKMFLMYEVSKIYDCYAGSMLMHRDGLTENDKLIAGPAWDYDTSFGRTLHKFLVGVSEPIQLNAEGWYNDSIGLLAVDQPASLLQELGKHASFMQHVAKIYNEYKAAFEGVAANVDTQRELLRASADMNNDLWGTHSIGAYYLVAPVTMSLLGTGKYALHYQVTVNWDAYVNNLREFATKRVMWLSDHLYEAEMPVGEIKNDGANLTVVLSAGNDQPVYQWQRSEDGSLWENIPDATAAKLAVSDDAQYRCLVSNTGAVICTTHGGKVPTYTTAILNAPAEVNAEPAAADDPSQDSGKTGLCKLFADIDRSMKSWYAGAVDWAVDKGITTGVSDTRFAPDQACTRGQVVTFLWRAAGKPAPKTAVNPFKDVAADAYYYDAVLWAVENGITTGMTEDTFEPDAPCTRAQVVTFLWRAAGKPAASGSTFSDVPANEWFTDAVRWATGKGITSGTSENTFSPDDACTRAHVVTFLYRNASGK